MKKWRWEWWVATLLLIGFVYRFSSLTAYFFSAVAVSFIGKPIVDLVARARIMQWQLGRGIGAAVSLAVLTAASAGLILLFVPLVQEQWSAMSQLETSQLVERWNDFLAVFDSWTQGVDLSGTGMPNSEYLANEMATILQPSDETTLFSGLITSLGNIMFAMFSVMFMSFFLMREPALFSNLIMGMTPENTRPAMRRILDRSSELLTRYFGGLVIQVIIVTLVVGVGLTIIGIPHAWLLGFLAGLFNLIPYVGPIFGAAFGALIMVSSGTDWASLGWAMTVYFVAQLVDNLFTQPVIFAKRVFAHPLEIFVVVSISGSLAGTLGMVLAIPGYTLFRIVAKEFLHEFQWIQALTDNMDSRQKEESNSM